MYQKTIAWLQKSLGKSGPSYESRHLLILGSALEKQPSCAQSCWGTLVSVPVFVSMRAASLSQARAISSCLPSSGPQDPGPRQAYSPLGSLMSGLGQSQQREMGGWQERERGIPSLACCLPGLWFLALGAPLSSARGALVPDHSLQEAFQCSLFSCPFNLGHGNGFLWSQLLKGF